MSSRALIFQSKQETDMFETESKYYHFRVTIRPNDLQKLTMLYKYNYKDYVIGRLG